MASGRVSSEASPITLGLLTHSAMGVFISDMVSHLSIRMALDAKIKSLFHNMRLG